MKHLKIVGLLVMTVASLMGVAGSASAQTITAPTGTEYTGSFSSSLEGSALLKAGFAEPTCTTGSFNGTITTNNNTEASGAITSISFTNCKEGQTVDTVISNGTWTVLKSTHAFSGTGTEVTYAVAGVSCVYGFGSTATSLGTAANSGSGSTERITFAITAKLPKISGGFLCASPADWTASFVLTSPSPSGLD
jgi:hypothetical protein